MSKRKSKKPELTPLGEITTQQRLNQLFDKFYGTYFDKLNKKVIKLEKGFGGEYEAPYIFIKGDGLTVPPHGSGAFCLNPPAIISRPTIQGVQQLQRYTISYEMAVRMLNDETLFKFYMDKIHKHALEKLEKNMPLDPNGQRPPMGSVYISSKMPGRPNQNEYFLELTQTAGYELRFYSDLAKVDYEAIDSKYSEIPETTGSEQRTVNN